MAATLQQHCATTTTAPTPSGAGTASATSKTNPQLKRIVYSKYRELLGSYNDKANAYIDTLPAYMVREDRGFHFQPTDVTLLQQVTAATTTAVQGGHDHAATNEKRGVGYEAPSCVQNAMMTKDKKPFTYTPGGIDLSQIKSERMAKRLARNAQAEGATGASQLNRPTNPTSPGTNSAAASMGAAAMGMPFQVLPPPPPPSSAMAAGKNANGMPGAPPPPPPPSTLAPPNTNNGGGSGSAPGSPNAARKSPTPQRFEPPPIGFRPEIKIPSNPMAALRKVPPPVEKNTFWKDEYVKDRSKSPMVGDNERDSSSPHNGTTAAGYSQPDNANNCNNNIDNEAGLKKSIPKSYTNHQQPETNNNNSYNSYNQKQQISPQQTTPQYVQQQQQYNSPPTTPKTPPQTQQPMQQQHQQQQQSYQHQPERQQSPRPAEFRSVAVPQSPAVNVYTRQNDSPRAADVTPPTIANQHRATDSPNRFGQQQQQQQRSPPTISPLAQAPQQPTTQTPSQGQQTVPWRTQRSPAPQSSNQAQSTQAIYNNVQQQQQQQQQQQPRSRDVFSPTSDSNTQSYGTQSPQYQGPKPTNVGTLYIAPLAPPTEPQAQNIVRQQLQQQQQQQQQRDSPMHQMPASQQQQQSSQQQQQQQQVRQPARWMTTQQQGYKEQPEWVRPEENGNVVPSTLQRIKSPPSPPQTQQQAPQQQQPQQQEPYQFMQGSNNGFAPSQMQQNFGAHPANAPIGGLRLQINANAINNNMTSASGPRERVIPIQLEQTPTYSAGQPNFNIAQNYGPGGASAAPAGYIIRSPNQFVDQGYNNYPPSAQQQQQQSAQRVMSPTQQLNAPRMINQQQQQMSNNNNVGAGGARTRVIPITVEGGDGTRGPISQSPIVLQNDPRTPPVQSKSFRILQKITDTIDDSNNTANNAINGSNNNNSNNNKSDHFVDAEPQLQRPTFARQMSAQQARNSPTIEQMRRMQIAQDQQQQPHSPTWNQDMPQQYVPPSEQQVPEPKKYTGSAIPSRSFKILQAMTTPENAGPGQSDL